MSSKHRKWWKFSIDGLDASKTNGETEPHLTSQCRQSRRKADTGIQYRPRIVDVDIDCGHRFADLVSKTHISIFVSSLSFFSLVFSKTPRKTSKTPRIFLSLRTPRDLGGQAENTPKDQGNSQQEKHQGNKNIKGRRTGLFPYEAVSCDP